MGVKCLDTYALIEISRGNPNFANYINANCAIPDLTLAEFYLVVLRDHNEKTADFWLKRLEPFAMPVSRNILIKAVRHKHEYRKFNLSFFDCAGYMFAIENDMSFVTGDKEFEGKESVEFVK